MKIVVTQMTFIFNLSVKSQRFPDSWKKALVIPIPKKGDPASVTNYRPISLLPQPGKILEKLVHNSLAQFSEQNMLLSHSQYGFRKNKSTLDALYQLTSKINTNMDSKRPTLVTFIDFRKAFDCVQHDLLIKKMNCMNINNTTLKWLESYLTNRQQQVLAKDTKSKTLPISQGVPQGSILMYIIYAIDITKILKHNHVTLYADDTVIFSSCKSLNEAHKRMQKDLNALQKWCTANGIFVNVSKTKFMLFGSKILLAKYNLPYNYLKINCQPIDRVRNYSYLGVTLDEQLNYEMHAINTIKRVKCKLAQLRRMKYCLNKQGALLVYKNMILPILEYGDIFMSSLSVATRKKLQVMQNKALRIALNSHNQESTAELHKLAKLSKLKVRRKLHVLQFLSGLPVLVKKSCSN